MDHIHHVCHTFLLPTSAGLSFFFIFTSIIVLMILQYKSIWLKKYGWVLLYVFIGWGPVSFQYMFSRAMGSLVSLTFSYELLEAFLSLKLVVLWVIADLLKLNSPPSLSAKHQESPPPLAKQQSEHGLSSNTCYSMNTIHTPQLNCSERILGQLRSLLVRGIVLLLNWGDIHMLLISGKNSGESDKGALLIFSLFLSLTLE